MTKTRNPKPARPARKKTHKELESWVQRLEERQNRQTEKSDEQDRLLAALSSSIQTIWSNQKELTKSQNLLDEQFAVSTRMAVMGLNFTFEKMGIEERVDEDDIEKLFLEWAAFRSRPDFRNYMTEWMLGVALDKLPPPPEPEAKKEGVVDVQSDHGNEDVAERVSEDGGASEADDVSEVQSQDRATG